ncbi:MAG: hypothetical protein JWM71_2053, partial [Solirubrobacteraceae bacterium]|nr:hypothetical protein [Solirubrobacteraceae bacterium]
MQRGFPAGRYPGVDRLPPLRDAHQQLGLGIRLPSIVRAAGIEPARPEAPVRELVQEERQVRRWRHRLERRARAHVATGWRHRQRVDPHLRSQVDAAEGSRALAPLEVRLVVGETPIRPFCRDRDPRAVGELHVDTVTMHAAHLRPSNICSNTTGRVESCPGAPR